MLAVGAVLLGSALLTGISGCAEPPAVVTQRVASRDRTLVAYIPRDGVVWFAKLSGPRVFVDPLESDFREIVDAMSFDDEGRLTTKLPPGWTRESGSGMRLATYQHDAGPMEIAVTQLGSSDPGDRAYVSDTLDPEYIRMNVSRWLRELNQPPRSGSWREMTEKRGELAVASIDGKDAYVFDFVGSIIPASNQQIVFAEPYVDYQVPSGWTERPGDAFRLAIFQVPGDVEATISSAGGSLVANMNRWERQVGLEPSSQQSLLSRMERLEVADNPALLIKLVGSKAQAEGEEPSPFTIVGVICTDTEKQYFVKLSGPAEAVDEAEADFREFLAGLEFG